MPAASSWRDISTEADLLLEAKQSLLWAWTKIKGADDGFYAHIHVLFVKQSHLRITRQPPTERLSVQRILYTFTADQSPLDYILSYRGQVTQNSNGKLLATCWVKPSKDANITLSFSLQLPPLLTIKRSKMAGKRHKCCVATRNAHCQISISNLKQH